MDELLEKVHQFAANAHDGQLRKYSQDPYIVHPERVMNTCAQYTKDPTILSAALLHDVLEDTDVTENELFTFLQTLMNFVEARRTVRYVKELTDEYTKDNYPQWNRDIRKAKELARLSKISGNSQLIKYADIIDNSGEVGENDKKFGRILLREYSEIIRALTKGNNELRKLARQAVMDAQKKL